jgi:hypothetical protein
MNSLGREDLSDSLGIEILEQLLAEAYALRIADQTEVDAAIADLDAKSTLQLAQMLIELAAEIGEPHVVGGLELQIQCLRLGGQGGGRAQAPIPRIAV